MKNKKDESAKSIRSRSTSTFAGLPLFDIAYGADPDRGEKRGSAHGVIAMGDQARGWIAMGGSARGYIAMGGKARGVVALGGISIGVLAMGGLALGAVAVGGLAAGAVAAGGLSTGILSADSRSKGKLPQSHEEKGEMMISGVHMVIFSKNADADRAFFRDVLRFKSVDAGYGWLIFALPPSEAAFHPADENGAHQLYFMCEDLKAEMASLARKGVVCSDVKEERWGSITDVPLPGGGKISLYQPKHPTAHSLRSGGLLS